MGVEDNSFQIEELNSNTSFFEWASKTNTEIINKLNRLRVYDGISGDGINVVVGSTADSVGIGGAGVSAGDMMVELADVINKGLTFNGDISINGTLNYDFQQAFTGVSTLNTSFTGNSEIKIGDVVRFDADRGEGAGLTLAKANSATSAEVLGIVIGDTEAEGLSIATHGFVNLQGRKDLDANFGLTAGCVHFLSADTGGQLTTDETTVVGTVSKPVLIATGTTAGVLFNFRGQFLSGTGGTGAAQGDNNAMFITGVGGTFTRGKVVSFNNGSFEITNGTNAQSMGSVLGVITEDNASGLPSGVVKIVTNGFVVKSPVSLAGPLFVNANGDLVTTDPGSNSSVIGVGVIIGADYGLVIHPTNGGVVGGAAGSGTNFTPPAQYSRNTPPNLFGNTGATGNASYVNDNLIANGSLTIWQRGIGIDGAHAATGPTYFADRWVRLDSYGNTGYSTSIERKDFANTQTLVEGNPLYFARLSNVAHGVTNSAIQFSHIENRVEGADSFRGENLTLSFYARRVGGDAGATCEAFIKQNYNGLTNETKTSVGTFELGTDFTKYVTVFNVPEMESAPTGTTNYFAVGIDVTKLNATIDLAQVKLEKGTASTPVTEKTIEEEYIPCARFYQRSYAPDIITGTSTSINNIPDSTSVNFKVLAPENDQYERFPHRMRATPTITLHSAFDGTTGDAYNRTAGKNMKLTAGGKGLNFAPRSAPAGAETITVQQITKDGILLKALNGFANFDSVAVHYVADADLNNNVDPSESS